MAAGDPNVHRSPLLLPCCYTADGMAELCMHADFCSTLNIDVDFIRLFNCINCIKMLAAGERALPRPPGESTRGKGRKEY